MTDVWVCGECHSINRQRDSRCYKCGAKQAAAATGEMATHRQEQAIALRSVVGYRPALPFAIAAAVFLFGLAAVAVAGMASSLSLFSFATQQLDVLKAGGALDEASWARFESSDDALGIVQIAIIVPLLVFFGLWLSRVVANVPALGGGIPGITPANALIRTLIPGVNLRTVPGVIHDVLYRLDPTGGGFFMVAAAWVGLVGSWLIRVIARWYLNARTFGDVVNARSLDEAVESVRTDVTAAVAVDVVTGILIAAGALILIALMIRIEMRSQARDAEVRAVAGV
ncbi:MAG TPA: zinc finger Ran-binding domain-containing protein [Candidatus Limnocylindrales bacterium]|jgi:hypothetical protein